MDFRVLKYFPFGRVKGHDVVGRSAFVQYIMAESETLAFTNADPAGPWQAFVMRHVVRAVNDGDLTSFVGGLRGEAWMLADACTKFQVGLIERAVLRDREAFITALLDVDPAVLRRRVPPLSQAIEFAFTYAKTRLLPTLLRIWRGRLDPLPLFDNLRVCLVYDVAHLRERLPAPVTKFPDPLVD